MSSHVKEGFLRKRKARAESRESDALAGKLRRLRAMRFRKQANFVDDPSRKKALLTPRQSGKTTIAASYLIDVALSKEAAECIFIAITRKHAKRIIWKELRRLDKVLGLKAKVNLSDLTLDFANGSTIAVQGVETEQDAEYFRGLQFDLIVIDECKSFQGEHFDYVVDHVLAPTMHARRGTICIMGTPGDRAGGAFEKATNDAGSIIGKNKKTGGKIAVSRPYDDFVERAHVWEGVDFTWSLHGWSMKENEGAPWIWEEALAEHIRKGESDDDPRWIREGLGKWCITGQSLVYKYDHEMNSWTPDLTAGDWGLPEGHEWRFVFGIDIGFDDPTAISVAAYSPTRPEFYHVYEFNQASMSVAEIAQEISYTEQMFGEFDIMIGDRAGLGKTIFKELEEVYDIALEPAEKHDKREYIQLLNSDFLARRCYVLAGSILERQLQTIQWDDNDKQRREDKAFPNDQTDSFLYLVRGARHKFSKDKVDLPEKGSREYVDLLEKREIEALAAAEAAKKKRGFLAQFQREAGSIVDELSRTEDDWWT